MTQICTNCLKSLFILYFVFIVLTQHVNSKKYEYLSNRSALLNLEWQVECWNDGQWVFRDEIPPLFTHHHAEHTHCLNRNRTEFFKNIKWNWQPPDTCKYERPSQQSFCNVLNGRNILFVGDSLQWEFFNTLGDFVLSGPWEQSQMNHDPSPIHICNGTAHSLFIRNDRISLISKAAAVHGLHENENIVEHAWTDYTDSGDYQILILNRGPHYHNDSILEEQTNILLVYLEVLIKKKNILVVYRTSVPGHPNCSLHTRPIEEELSYKLLTSRGVHWEKFQHQNRLMMEAIMSIKGLVLDVYPPTVLRADMHISATDCLHYCIPGPIDTWLIYFYNLLRLIK